MLGILKMAWGTVALYRNWIILAVASGVLISILVFYGNCRANAVGLEAAQTEIADLKADLAATQNALEYQNARIRQDNARKLTELAEANRRANQAQASVLLLRVERDQLKLQLSDLQVTVAETIRDDETFAQWANSPVPANTWGLLRAASQGADGSSLRTNH